MGLATLFNLDGKDIVAFFVAGLLGYLSATLVPAGTWAALTSILVSYHLFLAWLVITGENEAGISLRTLPTIATHLACLVLIVPAALAHRFIPFFGVFRYGIVGLAIFERGWLFTQDSIQFKSEDPITPPVNDTAEDYQEWMNYLAKQNPAARKPGSSLKEEYRLWMLARDQSRSTVPSGDNHPGQQ